MSGKAVDMNPILDPAISKAAMDFVTSIRAAVVSVGMYPPGSKAVETTSAKVSSLLGEVMKLDEKVTFSEFSGMLMVNGKQFDDKDKSKPAVRNFAMSLIERNIQSLTFTRGATPQELIRLLVLIAKKPQELADGGPLDQQLKAEGIENISLNSRIFVATDADQMAQDLEGSMGLSAMFKQFLQGNLDNVDVDGILDLLRDPNAAKDEFEKYLEDYREENPDIDEKEFVGVRIRELNNLIGRANMLLPQLEGQPEVQDAIIDSVQAVVAEVEPDILARYVLEQFEDPIDGVDKILAEGLFDKMDDEAVVDLTKGIITEIALIKSNLAVMDEDEQQAKIRAVRETVKFLIQYSKERACFADVARLLEEAGLIKGEFARQLREYAANNQAARGEEAPKEDLPGPVDLSGMMQNFETIPTERLASIINKLLEQMDDVLYHEQLTNFAKSVARRLGSQMDNGRPFIRLVEFSSEFCKHLSEISRFDLVSGLVTYMDNLSRPESHLGPAEREPLLHALNGILNAGGAHELIRKVIDGDDNTKKYVNYLLKALGGRAVEPMFHVLRLSEDRNERKMVMNFLQNFPNEVAPIVTEQVQNKDNAWYILRNIAQLMGQFKTVNMAEPLSMLASNPDERVRREALRAMAELEDNPLRNETFLQALNDQSVGVKRYAITMVGQLQIAKGMDQLGRLIEKRTLTQGEEEESIQVEAIMALARIGKAAAVEPLSKALVKEGLLSSKKNKTTAIRVAAARALANFPTAAAKVVLQGAAKDSDAEVKTAANQALSRMR